jgi:hypothetical protein
MNLTDYGRSIIRTIVPLIVGSVVGWLATQGIDVDRAALMTAVDTAIGGLYYVAVRAAEKRWPQAGWLLGAPGAPSYVATGGSSKPTL